MKKSTALDKLNELLGITEKAEEIAKKKSARQGKLIGVTEDEIQESRAIQGLMYFFQAPHLFDARVCKHCGANYLVSRKYVAYCSYTCIEASMRDLYGVEWKHKGNYEEAILNPHVFDGNEPFWIKNLDKLEECLAILHKTLQTNSESPSTPTPTLNQETPSSPSIPVTTSVTLPSGSRPSTTSYGKIPIPRS